MTPFLISKIKLKKIIKFLSLKLLIIFAVVSMIEKNAAAIDFNTLSERVLFFRDIHNFRGDLFKSKPINKDYFIRQSFTSSCNGLNRLIVPFYFDHSAGNDDLTFQLFQSTNNKTPIYTEKIYPKSWKQPQKLGGHNLYGQFQYVWIPPIPKSKNQEFVFELKSKSLSKTTGIYLTETSHPKVSSVQANDQILPGVFSGIFSYCQTRIDTQEIVQTISEKISQQKGFFIVYFLGITIFLIVIKKA